MKSILLHLLITFVFMFKTMLGTLYVVMVRQQMHSVSQITATRHSPHIVLDL